MKGDLLERSVIIGYLLVFQSRGSRAVFQLYPESSSQVNSAFCSYHITNLRGRTKFFDVIGFRFGIPSFERNVKFGLQK